MLGQKRLLLGIELTLFGLLLVATSAAGGGAQSMPGLVAIGVITGSIGLLIAIAGTLTPPDAR